MKVTALIEAGRAYARTNSHKILAWTACGGAAITGVLAFRAGMKCQKALEIKRKELLLKEGEKMDFKDLAETCWKEVIPPAIGFAGTCAAAIGSFKQADVKIEALNTAYKVVDQSYKTYKEQVEKEIGQKKKDLIEHAAAKKVMEDKHVGDVPDSKIIYCQGDVLFYDPLTDRLFKSDPETIRRIVNDVNTDMINGDMYISVNEWFDRVGLKHVDIGEELGWNCDPEHQMDVRLVPESVDDINGNEKLVWKIVYVNPPIYHYSELYSQVNP